MASEAQSTSSIHTYLPMDARSRQLRPPQKTHVYIHLTYISYMIYIYTHVCDIYMLTYLGGPVEAVAPYGGGGEGVAALAPRVQPAPHLLLLSLCWLRCCWVWLSLGGAVPRSRTRTNVHADARTYPPTLSNPYTHTSDWHGPRRSEGRGGRRARAALARRKNLHPACSSTCFFFGGGCGGRGVGLVCDDE